ncbi:BQ5605_C012g06752 [Microbotryum silenes-dioicae]|uniref:BQ5605_C012g06752 protein n=1 Tax=Microbotryum silenes-dioicae TaxID=796604 RepID=A0A2X0LWG2_9BASI|nr:BQ5605_C012g06752 [Microbotryum silenes-dioicae]
MRSKIGDFPGFYLRASGWAFMGPLYRSAAPRPSLQAASSPPHDFSTGEYFASPSCLATSRNDPVRAASRFSSDPPVPT